MTTSNTVESSPPLGRASEPLVRLPSRIRLKRAVHCTGLSADWRQTFEVLLPAGAVGTKGSGRFYEFRGYQTTEFLPHLWWSAIAD